MFAFQAWLDPERMVAALMRAVEATATPEQRIEAAARAKRLRGIEAEVEQLQRAVAARGGDLHGLPCAVVLGVKVVEGKRRTAA